MSGHPVKESFVQSSTPQLGDGQLGDGQLADVRFGDRVLSSSSGAISIAKGLSSVTTNCSEPP